MGFIPIFFTLAFFPQLIHLAAALIPPIWLLWYIYRKDKVEPEPASLLAALFFSGILSALLAILLETAGEWLLSLIPFTSDTAYIIAVAVMVGISEELAKFLLLKRKSWRDPNFNFKFDAIVYAVFVSLGFAAIENVGYVFESGLATALMRAVTSIPGHMAFSVYMGIFYGRARLCENDGDHAGTSRNLRLAVISAAFFHAFYDACAMLGSDLSLTVFLVFVVLLFIMTFRLIRHEAANDHPIV